MTRRTGPSAAVLELVKARNNGLCLRCSRRRGEQCHHRIPRGMGGTKNPIVNTAPALVWICGECHNWIESYRDKARGDGWLVRRGFDPAGQSLITTTDSLIMLTADGGVVPASLAGINEGPTPW